MKLAKKNIGVFAGICFLALVVGTLTWHLIEKVANLQEIVLDLNIGPIGFDISVISFWVTINPGSIIGFFVGLLLFKGMK